jgi:HD-GYP domain-containing protein (c-di-GMP phosphodiesterase class II)
MSAKIIPPSDLQPVTAVTLKLGMALQTPLYDEGGNLLLAKNQIIDTPNLLHSLREHPALFTDEASLRATARAVLSSFDEAQRRDAPLSRLDEMAEQRIANSTAPSAEVTLQMQLRAEAEAAARRTLPEVWTDLEASLGAILVGLGAGGDSAHKAMKRFEQFEKRFITLMERDKDSAVFLLFNRSVTQFNGYSALHSLMCAALAWDSASRLPVSPKETGILISAALTQNVSIKTLQDRMAGQKTKPTQDQLLAIDAHSRESVRLLAAAGVSDPTWLEVVARHHDDLPPCSAINDRPPAEKLAKILQVVDRYSAAMSPRGSRPGRESPAAVKTVLKSPGSAEHDEVGLDLVRNLGLYPPGTFVKLARGDAAVVLRRGNKLNEPLVASVLNRHGEPVLAPRVLSTESPEFAVQAALSGSSIRVRLNETDMIRQLSAYRVDVPLG